MQRMMYYCTDSQIIFKLFSNQQSMHDPVIMCIFLWVCVCVVRIRFCCFSEGWVWSVCVREGSGRSGCILLPGAFLSTRTFVVMHLSCRLAVCDFLISFNHRKPSQAWMVPQIMCVVEERERAATYFKCQMHHFHLLDQKTSENPRLGLRLDET